MPKRIEQSYGMRMVFLSLLATLLALPSSLAAQQWDSNYLPARQAGDLSVCTAGVDYPNAWFTTRFYEDRVDFLFFRDDFTLPYETELGALLFEIDGTPYALSAFTFSRNSDDTLSTAQFMQIIPINDDVVDLITALRVGTSFRILFPNGDYYNVSLRGSSAAITSALICWERNSTGPLNNNPFEPGTQPAAPNAVNNPFDT